MLAQVLSLRVYAPRRRGNKTSIKRNKESFIQAQKTMGVSKTRGRFFPFLLVNFYSFLFSRDLHQWSITAISPYIMRMKCVRWNSFFQEHHRKQSSSASHVHTYIYTSSLFKHNISSSQSNIEASCTNLFYSSVPISAMEVREFVENKRSPFTPLKVSPLVGFLVTSTGSEIQNLRAGHHSFYPHQARGTKWHTC